MSRQLPPRKIAPKENCPPDNWPLDDWSWTITLKIIAPLIISPWKLPMRKIAFRMICCLHNCHSNKWSQGKLTTRKIVPWVNYTRHISFPRIRNLSTLIDSCFLFSFFVVCPDNCSPDNCPLDDCPREIFPRKWPPRIIALWLTAPGLMLPDNYPKDNCSPDNIPL